MSFLLLETGDFFLLETGFKLILEGSPIVRTGTGAGAAPSRRRRPHELILNDDDELLTIIQKMLDFLDP